MPALRTTPAQFAGKGDNFWPCHTEGFSTLAASLTIARLRKAVAVLARLDAQGALENSQANGDSAKAVALRLGRAIDELELLLREVQPVVV